MLENGLKIQKIFKIMRAKILLTTNAILFSLYVNSQSFPQAPSMPQINMQFNQMINFQQAQMMVMMS